jgi:glycosyltransferase involved in cell wall biosynthesis
MARIALVHDIAGVATVQARILRDAGHEVDQMRLSEFGARWPWPVKSVAIPIRLAAYLPIVWRLRRNRYDVIHIHWVTQGIVGVLTGKPFFVQAHGSDLHVNLAIPGVGFFTRWILGRAQVIFYVTHNLRSYLRSFEAKLRYLPNPVDVDALQSPPKPPTPTPRVLIFTRLDAVKGPELIFPVVDRLSQAVDFTALAWGPLKAQYISRFGRSVRFVDPVAHSEIGPFLAQFDVIIGQMRQGILSLSEVEALAVGRPVITGIDWSLYANDPPPVVAVSGPDDIVAALKRLSQDRELVTRLCREGPDWARRNHGFAMHLELLESAYFGARSSAAAPVKQKDPSQGGG